MNNWIVVNCDYWSFGECNFSNNFFFRELLSLIARLKSFEIHKRTPMYCIALKLSLLGSPDFAY